VPQTPVAAAGWAPLGLDDGGRGGAGGGAPTQYRRDVIDDEGPQRPWIMWLLIAVAAAAIIGIVLLLTRGGGGDKTPVPETTPLPNLVGMTEQEARDTLSGLDLQFVQVTATSAEVEKGLVISSDPAGPTDVPAGSSVKVTISQGPDALTIPVLKNQPKDQALAILQEAGFTIGNVTWPTVDDPQVAAGAVVKTDPIEGSMVAADATINVYLSTGKVPLPNLAGMADADARAKLAELGLSVNPTEEDSTTVAPGLVIRQDPGAGLVDQHITVSIVIARAPVIQTTFVPGDLIGKSYSAAAAKLGQAGLNAAAGDDVFDKTVPEGFVASTDPAAGATVNEGSTVTIHLSKGPDPAAAP
jgi:serine/threonine-protein kinase